MRIGVMLGGTDGPHETIDEVVAYAKRVEAMGFSSLWMANIFGLEAITTLALVGRETERIELGTAVVPTYPRHPTAMAQQALTAQQASSGRFALGIGLSHKIVIEDLLGFSYEHPARHMREYLQVLGPLLRGENVDFEGAQYRVKIGMRVSGADPVPLLIAALGSAMLKLAGSLAQGTITWMTGPKTLADHIIPSITDAAKEAGREAPRVVAGFPIVLTDDAEAAREQIRSELAMYGMLPSYRGMLDREGIEGPAELALVGNATELRARIEQLREIGVTDFMAAIVPTNVGPADETLSFLTEVCA